MECVYIVRVSSICMPYGEGAYIFDVGECFFITPNFGYIFFFLFEHLISKQDIRKLYQVSISYNRQSTHLQSALSLSLSLERKKIIHYTK